MTKEQPAIIELTNLVLVDKIVSKARPYVHWIGMNYWAAQTLQVEWPYSKDTAIVVPPKSYDSWTIENVHLHELIEAQIMQKGMSYDEAHAQTLALVGWGSKWDS